MKSLLTDLTREDYSVAWIIKFRDKSNKQFSLEDSRNTIKNFLLGFRDYGE